MKKIFLISAGCISLTTGIIGIFLPILPTTPFLLLSAACFIRSSKNLYLWLINHKILGIYIKNYIEYKAITKKSKIISISLLWFCIINSALFFVKSLWIKIILFIIAICVTIHILKFNTLNHEISEKETN